MRAAQLTAYDQPFALVDLPVPEPRSGEVLVRVAACGVCGSDRFLQKGGFASTLPIVPGHEAAGTVASLGEGVQGLAIGRSVAIYYIDHCGHCRHCLAGRENICRLVRRMGVDYNGAMADYVRVPARCCLPLADGFDLAAAAVITDAVGTPTHALRLARLSPGDTVLVLGIGGIGSNAVQIAKVLGMRVIAASRSPQSLAVAHALGADTILTAGPNLAAAVRMATEGYGVDAVVQCAPGQDAYQLALGCLAKGGRMVVVGTVDGPLPLILNNILWSEHEVVGSRGFTLADIQQGLAWYEAGQIRVEHMTRRRRPLEELNEAIADLEDPTVVRTVITLQ